jgi:putative ABC transport system permease protein
MGKPGMKSADIVTMALGSLGVHKLRSFLTMAGITIGVFSVIGVMTTISALRGQIETGLSFLGADVFQFSKYPTGIQVVGNNLDKYRKRRNLTFAEAQRYRQLMEGTADVIRMVAWKGGGTASYGGHQTDPNVQYGGTNEHFIVTNQFTIDTGRNLTAEDVDFGRPVAIIGQTLVRALFPSESPLGKVVKIAGHAYTVVGTFAPKGTMFGGDADEIAIVPVSRFLSDNGADGYSLNIATQAPSPLDYDETVDRAIMAMRIARRLRPGDENDFDIYSNESLVAAFAKVADTVSDGAFVVSAIALLAAGVGIMNIMLVSVTERTKEIGIRKSIGARRASILTQFLLESVALSLCGGVVGILLGIVTGDVLAVMMNASIVFPWGWTAAALVVCSAIGIGFGLYPAVQAAGLDPIDALRYE